VRLIKLLSTHFSAISLTISDYAENTLSASGIARNFTRRRCPVCLSSVRFSVACNAYYCWRLGLMALPIRVAL